MNDLELYKNQLEKILFEFQEVSKFNKGDLIVIGCSTSEVAGNKIGTLSSMEVAEIFMPSVLSWKSQYNLEIAIQGCEHINRSLAVERKVLNKYGLEEVSVVPHQKAGGAFITKAYELFDEPAMVLSLNQKAYGGIDIGDTFIGMHLRRVAVPVRLSLDSIGHAHVSFARTRPMLVGGERAIYN